MASTIESLKRSGASRAPKFVRFNTPEFQDICSVPSASGVIAKPTWFALDVPVSCSRARLVGRCPCLRGTMLLGATPVEAKTDGWLGRAISCPVTESNAPENPEPSMLLSRTDGTPRLLKPGTFVMTVRVVICTGVAAEADPDSKRPVSYTHLTLPTIYSV